jgi:hypothetical protein
MPILYKYRSPQQLQFTLDILLNARLFAAPFSQLNDPMEGWLWYFRGGGDVWPEEIRQVEKEIERYRIVSLSANPVSTLMWTHYADSHRGVVIGVDIPESEGIEVVPVSYQRDFTVSKDATDIGLDILSKKAVPWSYEQEFRILTPTNFVAISPMEIIFGVRADDAFIDLVSRVAGQFCPHIHIFRLKQIDLDTYAPPPQIAAHAGDASDQKVPGSNDQKAPGSNNFRVK